MEWACNGASSLSLFRAVISTSGSALWGPAHPLVLVDALPIGFMAASSDVGDSTMSMPAGTPWYTLHAHSTMYVCMYECTDGMARGMAHYGHAHAMRGNGAHRAAWIMIAVHCREDASEAKESTREGSVKAVQHDWGFCWWFGSIPG